MISLYPNVVRLAYIYDSTAISTMQNMNRFKISTILFYHKITSIALKMQETGYWSLLCKESVIRTKNYQILVAW